MDKKTLEQRWDFNAKGSNTKLKLNLIQKQYTNRKLNHKKRVKCHASRVNHYLDGVHTDTTMSRHLQIIRPTQPHTLNGMGDDSGQASETSWSNHPWAQWSKHPIDAPQEHGAVPVSEAVINRLSPLLLSVRSSKLLHALPSSRHFTPMTSFLFTASNNWLTRTYTQRFQTPSQCST